MRFPKLSQLDRDQSAIYQGAPPDGTVLIVGPPGTGKSVIAFHRAQFLSKLSRNPSVTMYNKVLARYASSRGGVADDVPVSTFHAWVYRWWQEVVGTRGLPPFLDGENFHHDWGAMQIRALTVLASHGSARVNWGHLIIDEGQDFPPALYGALKMIMEVANASGASPKLAVTVLADENQRLTAHLNSAIEEIRVQLGLHMSDRNVFTLRANYRNSKEIARFAAAFYAGLPSGVPTLPTRSGDLPVVSVLSRDTHDKFLTACADKIGRYAKSRRTDEIAVLVMSNKERVKIVNRLAGRLEGSGVELQTYANKDETARAEDLQFDTPGRVTVLNYRSAKGLEFDAVFILDPGKIMSGGSSEIEAKMALYVMCSRARSMLNVMLVDDLAAKTLLSWLPPAEAYEQETF